MTLPVYWTTVGVRRKKTLRSERKKVNNIGELLKKEKLVVVRVMYCLSSSERLLKEEIDGLVDIMQVLGPNAPNCFAIVFTKADPGGPKHRKWSQSFDTDPMVVGVKAAFGEDCKAAFCGYQSVDRVKAILFPSDHKASSEHCIDPTTIRTVESKKKLKEKIGTLRGTIRDLIAKLQGAQANKMSPNELREFVKNELKDTKKLREAVKARMFLCLPLSARRELKRLDVALGELENGKLDLDTIANAEARLREKAELALPFWKLVMGDAAPKTAEEVLDLMNS